MPDSEVYTVSEVAQLLRVGRRQMYELVRSGQVPGVLRLGRTIRISRYAIDTWLSGPANGTEEAEPIGAAPTDQVGGDPPWKPSS